MNKQPAYDCLDRPRPPTPTELGTGLPVRLVSLVAVGPALVSVQERLQVLGAADLTELTKPAISELPRAKASTTDSRIV